MTSNERLMRIFQNKEVDRPALKLWGSTIGMKSIHPKYEPVCKLSAEISDIVSSAGSAFDMYVGATDAYTVYCEDTDNPLWKLRITEIHVNGEIFRQVFKFSTVGEPGFLLEHFVKEPEDLTKILKLAYKKHPFSAKPYFEAVTKLGDRGIVNFSVPHAGYAVQELMGSEMLAYMSIDERPLLDEAISLYTARVLDYVKDAINHGVRGVFGWVGPELLTPPLLNTKDFNDFCVKYDKLICDEIHNAGGYVWVHCHGKVAKLLDDFIKMGVDVLNPLEPPKNGDVSMDEIVKKYGNRIGLEGNIEIQDILLGTKEELCDLIYSCVEHGSKSGRFILCPSAGFMEYPIPTDEYIANLIVYLKEGLNAIKKFSHL